MPNSLNTNHNPDPNATTAPDYDSNDSVFSLNDNNEDDDQLKLVAPRPIVIYNPWYVPFNDSDGDYILSDCESDGNEYGVSSDNEHNVLSIMDADMRVNLYIPSHAPMIFRVGKYFKMFIELAWAVRQHAVENSLRLIGTSSKRQESLLGVSSTSARGCYMLRKLDSDQYLTTLMLHLLTILLTYVC